MPKYALMQHQIEGVKFLDSVDGIGALLYEPGVGKTGTTLSYIDMLATRQKEVRVLVVGPKTAADTWVLQAPPFMDSVVKARMLQGSTAQILAKIAASGDWRTVPDEKIQTNHPGTTQAQVSGNRVTILSMSAGAVSSWCSTQVKTVSMLKAIRKYAPHVVVVDESQIIKSATATISKAMYQIGQLADHRIILTGTVTPHALTMEAPILTPAGWKQMRDMRIGDFVIGSDGKPTEVVGVWPQGVQPIYTVTFSDGTSTDCTADHLWQVQSRGQRSRGLAPLILSTSELTKGRSRSRVTDKEIGLFDKGGSARWAIPLVRPVQFPETPVPVDPYLLGILLGDGHLGRGIEFTTMDPEIVDYCSEALPDGLQLTVKHRPEHSRASQYRITSGVRGGSEKGPIRGPAKNELHQTIEGLGLRHLRSWEKFVPTEYLMNSEAVRLGVLRGLMDADGSGRGRTNKFTTTSPRLAEDVKALVRSLGGYVTERMEQKPPRVMPQGHTSEARPQHVLLFTLHLNPFRLPRKADQWVSRGKDSRTKSIVSIEPKGDAEAQCITVAAADGLYVTGDFVLTHNSPLDVYGQWRFLAPWTFSDQHGEPFTKAPLKMTKADKAKIRPWPWGRFRARYGIMGGYLGHQVVDYQNKDDLNNRVAERSHVVLKEDALDLPPVTDVDVHVQLSPKEAKAYKEMRDDLAAQMADGSLLEAPNALAKIMKLRQITAGFARDTVTEQVHVIGDSKRKAIKEVCEVTLGGEQRLVVFAYFRSECALLAEELRQPGTTVEVITGATPSNERLAIRQRFADVSENPERTILVAQITTMSLSVNELVTAQNAVFCTLSDRRDVWVQARGRLDRNGQVGQHVTFWNVFVPGSIDQVILERHKDRGDLEKALLDHIRFGPAIR